MNNQSEMSVMIAAPSSAFDSTWFPDSGATNHITPDPNNVINKPTYAGSDHIHVGGGASVAIHNIGFSSFQSKFNSKVLSLKHLIHVPSITKNLLSVSKFASYNLVFFEFFPNSCYVRDRVTRNISMEERLMDGLYAFEPPLFLSYSPRVPTWIQH